MNDRDKSLNHLRRDLQRLEDQTQAPDIFRLAQARNRALSQTHKPRKKIFWSVLAGSVASALVIAVFVNWQNPASINTPMDQIYANNPAFDYYQSDEQLNVYYWLAESDEQLDRYYQLADVN